MDKKVKNPASAKGRSAVLTNFKNGAIIPKSYVIPTASTSVPGHILPTKDAAKFCQPLHQHGTRQRSSLVALQQEHINLINSCAKTKVPTTPQHITMSQSISVKKNQNSGGHNDNANSSTVSGAKTAAVSNCIASPTEHLSAFQAKTSAIRNKNEEAITDLRTRIPEIENIFDIHSRIGNGTFSTVLLGTLKKQRNLPENQKRKFAIKHHIPTSHPDRIMKELQCMTKIGGIDNVVGINCCIRYNESVAFIMPYLPHDRFHDFYNQMDVFEVQHYMKNLLIALRHVHRFNVIHRDVKPSNFLYNRRKRQFLLVDFGLAQQIPTTYANMSALGGSSMDSTLSVQSDGKRSRDQGVCKRPIAKCEPAATVTDGGAPKRLKYTTAADVDTKTHTNPQINGLKSCTNHLAADNCSGGGVGAAQGGGSNISLNESTMPPRKSGGGNPIPSESAMNNRLQQKFRNQGQGAAADVSSRCSSSVGGAGASNKMSITAGSHGNGNTLDAKYNTNRNLTSGNGPKCFCYGNPQVCNICLVKKEIHASRAGTPGYRPPEVLLKYPDQTTAVDVWAAGVIFLSVLSSVYPFFKAPNDYVALAEIVTIFGDKTIRKTAFTLDRLVTLSQKTKPLDLRKLCVRFRNRAKFSSPLLLKKYQRPDGTCEVCKNCDQFYFNCLCMETNFITEPVDADDIFPPSAYDLLYKLLEVNPHKRITADEALKHEFFKECQNNNNNVTTSIIETPTKQTTPPIALTGAAGDSLKKPQN